MSDEILNKAQLKLLLLDRIIVHERYDTCSICDTEYRPYKGEGAFFYKITPRRFKNKKETVYYCIDCILKDENLIELLKVNKGD